MQLGIHAYAWCSVWSNDTLDLIDRAQNAGLDFLEIPLMVPELFDFKAVKDRLKINDFKAVTSTVLSEGTDISSDNDSVRNNGISYLKKCIQFSHEIEASTFSGVIYSQHVKNSKSLPGLSQWQTSAKALREVARYAQDLGVTIALEPVNRYETNLINTCHQALEMIKLIDEDNVKIHLDSYHMNIEEKSFYESTLLAGNRLVHYHLCENDRGIPGTGLVDWDGIFKALNELNYQGNAALESFVDITDNMNTWVWRQLAPSGDLLIKDGVNFIRKMQIKYGL